MKKTWIIIISIVIAGGIAGGGIYTYYNSKAVKDKNNLQTQLDAANDKIATLNEEATSNQNANTNGVTSNSNTNANTNTNSTVNADIATAKVVANQFMSDEKTATTASKTEMLDLMTPAVTQKEKDHFDFLTGLDSLPATAQNKYPDIRVDGGSAGFGYKITSFSVGDGMQSGTLIIFPVTETRTWPTGNGGASQSSTNPGTTYLEMTTSGTKWMVNQYYQKNYKEDSQTTTKYSGFYL